MDFYYNSDGVVMKKEKEMNIFDSEIDKYPADFMVRKIIYLHSYRKHIIKINAQSHFVA